MGALFRFERSMTGGVHRKRDGHGPTKQRLNASEYLPSSPGRNTRKSRIFLPVLLPTSPAPRTTAATGSRRGAAANERGLSTDQNSFTKDISNPEGLLWGVLHRASTVKAGQEDNQGAHNSSSTGGFLLNAAKKATWIKKGNGGTTISCCARVAVNNGARDKAIGSSEE
uniref:Uncharacterized protein n=1 Tax=Oryza nivara TaxID=4536 RepID=A0A0E0GEJ1_ORYNI